MLRRDVLAGLMALAAGPAFSADTKDTSEPGLQLGTGLPFNENSVLDLARNLSKSPYRKPRRIPEAWSQISYDEYVSIWFDGRNSLWQDEPITPLRADVFAPGLYFPHPVSISVVENGEARPMLFDLDVFDKTDKFPDLPIDDSLGYSGLRLRSELQAPGIFQEFAVFQGASYFRAIGTGETYGVSARGLAIDTADASGEEFPEFRAFWLEKPGPGAREFILHALLDSPSCTGAYRFAIWPGKQLDMRVESTIFPRRQMDHVGIAPLTSMFQFDQTNRDMFSDFRPAVHDSDGLLIHNGAGETIWRPLANPKSLQVSSFLDNSPRGFGLMQRARKFSDFADLEALYHERPGVWVQPGEAWGEGTVRLVEIPTDREIFDNIVCYWRPSAPLKAGKPHRMTYRLLWGENSSYGDGVRVRNTSIGAAQTGGGIVFAIDFDRSDSVPDDLGKVEKLIRSSTGEVSAGVLERNPETGGPRLAFRFHPHGAKFAEFRVQLRLAGGPLSEVWLYRWTT